MSILDEVPLGRHRMEVGMKLREVMLLNGILYNSEAWHGVTVNHVKTLEAIDEELLRKLLKAHRKTPREFLYLETGATPIQWVIAQRRINFLKHILGKDKDELVFKVFQAQKDTPTSGDFIQLVEKDMINLNTSYEEIKNTNKILLKKHLKTNATSAAFRYLKGKLHKHKKIKHIQYSSLKMQPYLRNPNIHYEETHVITALRSKCVRNVRSNFSKMYKNRIFCPLKCNQESEQIDTQEHLLTCSKINIPNSSDNGIQGVYLDQHSQESVGKLVLKILKERKRLLEDQQGREDLPGVNLDQSTLSMGAAAIL